MNSVNINCYCRIHISLLNMANNLYQNYGGIGFFIDNPALSIKVEFNPKNLLQDNRSTPIPYEPFLTWLQELQCDNNIQNNFKITISGNAPSHMGFGVSTAVRMACVEGIYKLINKAVSNEEIIKLSHRGGTSGIGVHGYFNGGFIFDLGNESSLDKHLPSRSHESKSHLPLLLKNIPMPEWELGILIPKNIPSKTHAEEKKFFQHTCPIDETSVYETTYHALFGVLASVQTENFEVFCSAINSLQQQTWKKAERELYPELKQFEDELKQLGALATGMSSLGPSLYFFSSDLDQLLISLNNSQLKDQMVVLKAKMCNQGRMINHV